MTSVPEDARRICPACEAAYEGELELCPVDGARLLFPRGEPDRFIGKTLDGRFRIDAKIGGGAMGTVYSAYQHSVQRAVAIKIMNPKMGATAIGVRRFLREARLASKLSQPSTVSVMDFGQTRDGDLFLVMELLEGRTLLDVVRAEGPFDLARVVRVGAQLCDALEAAHAMSIVHRDLKPGNVLVLDNPAGRDLVKVLDFGLAKSTEGDESEATMTGQVVGTPRYMAPELWMGGAATVQSDLYALGVLLGEMATGRPLFRAAGGGVAAVMAERLASERVTLPEEIGPPLRPIIEKLLAREARDRYGSAPLLRADLVACLGSSGELSASGLAAAVASAPAVTATPPTEELTGTTVTVADKPVRIEPPRRRWIPYAAAGIAVAVLAAVLGSKLLGGADEAPDDPPPPSPSPSPPPPSPSPPPPAVAPTPTSTVEIELRATPPAKVIVGGKAKGTTPQTLTIPKGDRPIAVLFERKGSKPVKRTIVPDRDQMIEVAMPVQSSGGGKKKPKYPF